MVETSITRPVLPGFPISAMNVDSAASFPTFPSSAQDAQEWWESTLTFSAPRGAVAPSSANAPEAVSAEGGGNWGACRSSTTYSRWGSVHWNDVLSKESSVARSLSYISNTELADGRQALLVDPGSWNNLSGAPWSTRTAQLAQRNGLQLSQ